jgi:hypothetical protein
VQSKNFGQIMERISAIAAIANDEKQATDLPNLKIFASESLDR